MTSDLDSAPIPSFAFSAGQYSGHDRFGAWQHQVAQLFVVSPTESLPTFEGDITGYMLDGILVAQNGFSGQKYRRDRRLVAQTGLDAYMVQLYTSGGFDGHADHKEMSVRAGDVCVFDLADTLATEATRSSTVSLVVPKLMVDRHWNARTPVNGMVIAGHTALGQVMGAHLAALNRAMPDVKSDEAPVLAATTARLIADALAYNTGGGSVNGALRQALRDRATEYIRRNVGSPELSPETICRALNVSRPHLYRAFEGEGGVMRVILDHRLRSAFAELSDPRNRAEKIGSIAFRCGFSSGSHFTRTFREAFGVRPVDVRDGPAMPAAQDGAAGLTAWLSSPNFLRR
jgi:AraC-like DNA-binding protein